jgi:glycosyltransferase involved in cell wall biosynthesis
MRIDMKPQVSVVVTCYNYGKFVAESLESLQKQTFSDFEVIIVDDGSTDNSAEQICPYLKDCRFRYIKQKNGGQANAKNRGIKESTAEFIAFLDADDLWEPEKLEKQTPLFARQEMGVVYSRAASIDPEGRPLPMHTLGQYLQPRRSKVTEYLIYDNFVPFSSAIVRKDCFNTFGVFDESLAMGIDWDLWLRFSTKYQFDYCEEPYLLYRVGHSGQMSKNLLERFRCADRIVAKFKADFPDAVTSTVMQDTAYYSCCLRGYALRQYGLQYPLKYYWKAISLFPFRKKAYLGLLKAPIRALFGR